MAKKLTDLDLRNKRVLVRVDFNVPLDKDGNVTSDARIRESLPTIQAILKAGGKPVLMAHLGRPKGKVVESMRLLPAAKKLQQLLGSTVKTCGECVGPEAEAASRAKSTPAQRSSNDTVTFGSAAAASSSARLSALRETELIARVGSAEYGWYPAAPSTSSPMAGSVGLVAREGREGRPSRASVGRAVAGSTT